MSVHHYCFAISVEIKKKTERAWKIERKTSESTSRSKSQIIIMIVIMMIIIIIIDNNNNVKL